MIGVRYKNESRTPTAGFIHLAHEWGRVHFYSLLDRRLGERMLDRHKTVTHLLLLKKIIEFSAVKGGPQFCLKTEVIVSTL